MQFKRRTFLALLFFTSAVFTLACGSAPEPNANNAAAANRGPGTRGGSATYRLSAAPKTLNPLLVTDEPSIITSFFVMNSRLVTFDPERQVYAPSLAESFTLQPDGQTLDLTLRNGLKFSDGEPITVDDVIFTMKAIYDERTQSVAFRDSILVGGKEIAMEKVNELQMKMVFPERVASAENYLENVAVLPEHVLKDEFEAGKLAETWKTDADPASIVTSGPFAVASSVTGERLVLKRNPHYWKTDANGTQLPYLDELVFVVVPDANNAFVQLEQGQIDIYDRIRSTDFAALKTKGGNVEAYDLGPGFANDHMWFNLNRTTADGKPVGSEMKFAWFSDEKFRRAVAHAVDRESIAKNTLQGLATPLYGFVSPANRAWLATDLPKAEYDLERAASLLSEAGFVTRGDSNNVELLDANGNRVEFTLAVQAENEPRKLMAATIQQDLAKLGIKMNIATVDNASLTKLWTATYDYDAVLLGLATTGTDPSSFANFLLSGAAVHQWQPSQKTPATEWEGKIDELFGQLGKEPDLNRRKEIFNEIQKIVAEKSPIIPIVSRHVVSAANTRIGNYAPANLLPFSLWNVEELFIRQ